MSAKKENATIIGVGVAACAVCCAGPILGARIGLGTAAGFALFGARGGGSGWLMRDADGLRCASADTPELFPSNSSIVSG